MGKATTSEFAFERSGTSDGQKDIAICDWTGFGGLNAFGKEDEGQDGKQLSGEQICTLGFEASDKEAASQGDRQLIVKKKCTLGHELTSQITPSNRWWCSQCFKQMQYGTRLFGCRICNYDECLSCVLNCLTAASCRALGEKHMMHLEAGWPDVRSSDANSCETLGEKLKRPDARALPPSDAKAFKQALPKANSIVKDDISPKATLYTREVYDIAFQMHKVQAQICRLLAMDRIVQKVESLASFLLAMQCISDSQL